MTVQELIAENRRRNEEITKTFNPLTGQGSILDRAELHISDFVFPIQYVPLDMLKNKLIQRLNQYGSIRSFLEDYLKVNYNEEERQKVARQIIRIRNRYDFCFWAISYVRIKNKDGGDDIPFRLNRPQRRLVQNFERMRLAGKPIRLILLKARQWGGSTAVQIYMAWIQLCHKTGWNSLIVAHVKDASHEVKGMFSKLMDAYPAWLLHDEGEEYSEKESKLVGFEGAANIEIVPQRNNKIKIGTAVEPDSARGGDSALVHCTEVAFWKKTDNKTPEQIVRSACSGALYAPLTLVVYESTSNGTDNYFHDEYQSAKACESEKEAMFVSWYEIEKYALAIEDEKAFATWLFENRENNFSENSRMEPGKYYWWLWEKGATFEAINWYLHKRSEFQDHADMAAEYPSDDIEAFKHSGAKVFDQYKVEKVAKSCKPPKYVGDVYGDALTGKKALSRLRFTEDKQGVFKVWQLPDTDINVSDRYLTIVDVGGRSKKADYSVICVIDRFWMMEGSKPSVVAEWCGHIDHDLLAWKAVQIAAFYNNSLLVIESNTLETKDKDRDVDGDQTSFILNQIADVYDNLYARKQSDEQIREGIPRKWGFHTNTKTKPMIISYLIMIIRENLYTERDRGCIVEYLTYEKKQNGSYGAIPGRHDDKLMTRAIGLFICFEEMPLPKIIEVKPKARKRKPMTAATI